MADFQGVFRSLKTSLFSVCACVCAHVVSSYLHACPVHVCRGQSKTLGVFVSHSLPYCFKIASLTVLEACSLTEHDLHAFTLQVRVLQACTVIPDFLHECQGTRLRSSGLQSRSSYPRSHATNPWSKIPTVPVIHCSYKEPYGGGKVTLLELFV